MLLYVDVDCLADVNDVTDASDDDGDDDCRNDGNGCILIALDK